MRNVRKALLYTVALVTVASLLGSAAGAAPKRGRTTAKTSSSANARIKAINDKIEQSYRKHKSLSQSFTGTLTISANGDEMEIDFEGKAQYARPGLFRIESTTDFSGVERHSIIVCNGKQVWDYNPDDQQYSIYPLSTLPKKAKAFGVWLGARTAGDGTAGFFMPKRPGEKADTLPNKITSVQLDDKPAYRLDMLDSRQHLSAYVDAEDMLMRKAVMSYVMREQGIPVRFTMTLNYSDIVTDNDMPQDAFTFMPPDGAQQVANVTPLMKRTGSGQ